MGAELGRAEGEEVHPPTCCNAVKYTFLIQPLLSLVLRCLLKTGVGQCPMHLFFQETPCKIRLGRAVAKAHAPATATSQSGSARGTWQFYLAAVAVAVTALCHPVGLLLPPSLNLCVLLSTPCLFHSLSTPMRYVCSLAPCPSQPGPP